MTFLKTTLIAAIAALTSHAALAHDFKAGEITIEHPMSFATPPGAAAGAGYMIITNNGEQTDRLIAVQSNFPKTMIHKTEMVGDVMQMRHQMNGVLIPAGETITFEPGGLHVMFMGLESPMKPGEKNTARLVFERSGSVDVVFNVEKRAMKAKAHDGHSMKKDAAKTMDHSGHSN